MGCRDKLIDLQKHYMKIKKQWTSCDSIIKIVGISIGGISGLVTVIITPIVGIPLVGIVIGSFSACDLFLTEALSIGLTARKKKIYREVCECLNMAIAKLWTYQNKALTDQLISDIEMEGARNIVRECINDIVEIKKNCKNKK